MLPGSPLAALLRKETVLFKKGKQLLYHILNPFLPLRHVFDLLPFYYLPFAVSVLIIT